MSPRPAACAACNTVALCTLADFYHQLRQLLLPLLLNLLLLLPFILAQQQVATSLASSTQPFTSHSILPYPSSAPFQNTFYVSIYVAQIVRILGKRQQQTARTRTVAVAAAVHSHSHSHRATSASSSSSSPSPSAFRTLLSSD